MHRSGRRRFRRQHVPTGLCGLEIGLRQAAGGKEILGPPVIVARLLPGGFGLGAGRLRLGLFEGIVPVPEGRQDLAPSDPVPFLDIPAPHLEERSHIATVLEDKIHLTIRFYVGGIAESPGQGLFLDGNNLHALGKRLFFRLVIAATPDNLHRHHDGADNLPPVDYRPPVIPPGGRIAFDRKKYMPHLIDFLNH